MKTKSNIKRNILLILFLFTSFTAITYALGTWNTGFRAINGADTTVDINVATPVFDNLIVENNVGQDMFVPTKTFAEMKSLWDNAPDDSCVYTEKETVPTISLYETYGSYNETTCDTPENPWGSGNPYLNARRFQVLEVESPGDLEAYINFRFRYSEGEQGENVKIFLQKEGGATVPKAHFIALYNDGGATGLNGPDLDYNNDGTDDLYFITIDDVWQGDVDRDISIASENTIKLFGGTNYIRIEGYDNSNGEFFCEGGVYASSNSVSYSTASAGVWFSSGRCGETSLFDKPFHEATLDPTISGWAKYTEAQCDNSSTSPFNSGGEPYIHNRLSQMIGIYVPETMTGHLNFRGHYDGSYQMNESFYVYKQKVGGSPVTPYELHRIFDDNGGSGPNGPDYDYNNDGTDDIERIYMPDANNTHPGPGEVWENTKTSEITFFKGMNYMMLLGENSSCETGATVSDNSINFDSQSVGSEGRVWITLD